MYKRLYMKKDTALEFDLFQKELEIELRRNLSQDDFATLLVKYKVQILDVIVTAESVLNDRNPGQEQEVPA